jgi:dipeptidyl aminopeptidase/acylaminoacyl peptidase
MGEGFARAPEIAVIRSGSYTTVKSLDVGFATHASSLERAERVAWRAPDGLEIQGWLLLPHGRPPLPLIMNVHGGPVYHAHPFWLGRGGANLLLLKRGFAIFLPNPRGSSGRGREFAHRVVGDMGGADTADCLSGLDHLVQEGIADERRLGVTGASYGGFMSSWLITQDTRFAAAVAIAPVTNQTTWHLLANIPHFVRLFLNDTYSHAGGRYFQRSPVMHARKVRTPTLHLCGGLDTTTRPEEAVQFHNALREHGVHSVLVMYPQEGHGIRKWPAVIDFAARIVGWFEHHLRSV